MPKNFHIELDALQRWLNDEEVTYAYSAREQKRLVSTLQGGLRVTVAGSIIYEGINPSVAVEQYNSVTDKYIDPTIGFKL